MDWNLSITSMGILPHRSIDDALRLSLSLDIPFLPQLPNLSFYEDMYVQTSSNFPGIILDLEENKIFFSKEKFYKELEDYMERMEEDEDMFRLRAPYSSVYDRFLKEDLSKYIAIRGQVTGPVSFGFRIFDGDGKPIIYDDEVREILFDFIKRKVNTMLGELREKNENAFVWIDEPGLGWIFSGMSGYTDVHAKEDFQAFFEEIDGIKGMHLCAEVDVSYLLSLGLNFLSFDAFQLGFLSDTVAKDICNFIENGGIIVWGIAPNDPDVSRDEVLKRILSYFEKIESLGMDREKIIKSSLLAPSRCLVKFDRETGMSEEEMVEKNLKGLFDIKERILGNI